MIDARGAASGERVESLADNVFLRRRERDGWPQWSRWNRGTGRPYTIGVEEELMLLDRADHSLAQSGESVLARLSDELSAHISPETHAGECG
jgi:hypothetical protein